MKSLQLEVTEDNYKNVLKDVLDFVGDIPCGKHVLELKKQTRSGKQNRAIHLLFTKMADALNNEGQTFRYTGFSGGEMEMPWSGELVKNFLWRPVQILITGKESTTKLTTAEVDLVFVPLNEAFAKKGIEVRFPSEWEKYLEQTGQYLN